VPKPYVPPAVCLYPWPESRETQVDSKVSLGFAGDRSPSLVLNFDNPSQNGAYQVGQALAAVGSGRARLKFLVIDVESEKLRHSNFPARITEIRQAVNTAKRETGLPIVIYTDRDSWARITHSCSKNPANNCSDLIDLPLWDVEHRHHGPTHCGDGIPGCRGQDRSC